MAIVRQRPAAKMKVAGFQTLKELGRHVKKGEKGIQIIASDDRLQCSMSHSFFHKREEGAATCGLLAD
jgi:N-terminal domain of anti-restriction factor ArdC